MAFLSSLNISASALTAQRMRMDIISENITNIDTTRTEEGGPYRRKMVVFEATSGGSFRETLDNVIYERNAGSSFPLGNQSAPGVSVTEILEDPTEFKLQYNPDHPDADADGYVRLPNVDILEETVDSMAALKSYQASVTMLNATKEMAQKALEIR